MDAININITLTENKDKVTAANRDRVLDLLLSKVSNEYALSGEPSGMISVLLVEDQKPIHIYGEWEIKIK